MKSNFEIHKVIFSFIMIFNMVFIFIQSANAQMYWNQACQFAGNSGSYVAVQNSSSIDITGSFTIEAWINPSILSGASKGIVSKGGALGTTLRYGLRLSNTGKIVLITNGAQRLTSKNSTTVPANTWTHVAATYSTFQSEFKIYINGILDTSSVILSANPTSNSDSLYIGISGASTPFAGQIDEVRIWGKALSSTEVGMFYRTSHGVNSGIYSGLVLSTSFQKQSNSSPFSFNDMSGRNNNGFGRNVSAVSQSFNPYVTIGQNECIELDGDEDYLAAYDTDNFNPSTNLTLECWIYPRSNSNAPLIRKHKNNLSNISYSLNYLSGNIQGTINDIATTGSVPVSLNTWSHVAMTYDASISVARIYVDGIQKQSKILNAGNITPGVSSDSLYIGGVPGATPDFNGFIDEVRLSERVKSGDEIFNRAYSSIDKSNDPDPVSSDICYNLDGYNIDNAENGGSPLTFRNDARFSHSALINDQPRSPLLRDQALNFPQNYYSKTAKSRIPATSTSGLAQSLKDIGLRNTITDIDVYVNLNHTKSSTLKILLVHPDKDSLVIFDGLSSNTSDNNLALIFDDQADSVQNNNAYSSFCSRIKPLNNLNSKFSGKSPRGLWALKIRDQADNDTGMLYAWGIKFNNMSEREKTFSFASYIQGMYDSTLNVPKFDTTRIILRNFTAPFAIVDSSKDFGNSGNAYYSFTNVQNNVSYYVQLKHRNSIETWSNSPIQFLQYDAGYNFITSPIGIYGNNVILVDSSPIRYGVYSGDENQDGFVNLADVVNVSNNANTFLNGYYASDMNGDDLTDLADIVITLNNANVFVSKITP